MNRPSFLSRVAVAAIVLVILAGCASTTAPPGSSRPVSPLAYRHFVNGDLLELSGHAQAALDEYLNALKYDSLSVDVRLAVARTYGSLGQWEQAATLMEETIEFAPGSIPCHLLLGDCLSRLNEVELAKQSYETVRKLDPENIQAHHKLALIREYQGQPEKALEHYGELVRLVSKPEEILLRRASLFIRMGKWERALGEFQQALALREDLLEAHMGIAQVYQAMGQPERSIAYYQEIIRREPGEEIRLRFLLGELFNDLSRPQEAIAQFQAILEDDPQNIPALKRLANLLFNNAHLLEAWETLGVLRQLTPEDPWVPLSQGRVLVRQEALEEAIPYFQEAIDLDETAGESWLGLGVVLMQAEQYDQATELLQQAALVLPQMSKIHHLLGISHLRQEAYPEAVEALERSLTLAPEEVAVMRDLAVGYERADRFDEAADLLRQVLQRDPEDHWSLNYLGYMLADRGVQLKEAHELIERALELNPGNGAYLDSMGWVSYRLGKLDLAEDYLSRAIAVSGDEPVMHDHLGDVYLRQGKEDQALQQWRNALQLSPDDEKIKEKLERFER